ncbi:bifunctional demethylmenaquinone methyltransferase/2-methoxy-6-polyprenyl-1,4-benzoquinol methylase [Rickettsia sp. MEAM1 (Bemisia tabaci)]|uniref:bifunctional demethylmenaquinone methyltransferase/2-methoxy-6-polyprenyl-1,4-benzoquinol methylase UbiE n=1 Tax=unclassified Rickettsia TaxID=114295 RepID=UPI0002E49111|nr:MULTISPECIES: bifunctional demethylmenaquinone methyltransferase/2-methoxy-6-polyprenyl-1,4-benzoquinol methylase UbiE [unclassified Rickettsia]ASX27653.1 bifunctional demethylmenaquinone methyltransferase/2-methoxy-6-polyprenyl-1,4-benzoquinol methylase [Rickettsia sp. MEAM1 (Bemisia tabaci)]ODA37816.1 bifunctional demethylmenaquinone methyltransferase/2-methoxy-6-polyprenyl-1,4-benzoquinol methylase [Rickettsia sp. wb]ODA38608.1 bifunctional demethylmenaquinone methyltransferase/2-methoxy-6
MNQTNFGFKKIDIADKQPLVNNIFSNVADKYDLMNDLMSFGMHRLWKDEFIRQIPNLNSNILDVASGSGDIALKLAKKAKDRGSNISLTLSDINEEMLRQAKKKSIDLNLFQNLKFTVASAEELPFPDNSFDYYTIAFGIRNVPDINKALKEAYRVLKPMGKFVCLEFSKVKESLLQDFYKFYSFNVIPKIGQIITGNKEAYDYLVESIDLFPSQDEFRIMIKEAGFEEINYKNLSGGIVVIHSAYKL